jgi:hypothetical protein
MGRHLEGTGGFSYTYAHGEEPSLADLARVSRAGSAGIAPLLAASMGETDLELPVAALAREIASMSGEATSDLTRLLIGGDLVPARKFEALMRAASEHVVELLALVDAKVPEVPESLTLCARGAYELDRDDWDDMLRYVNGFLGEAALSLDDVRSAGPTDRATSALSGVANDLPHLGLRILHHAASRHLERVDVREALPETSAADYWTNVRTSSGPPIFEGDLPGDVDSLFARGLVHFFDGDRLEARRALRRAFELGDGRARRWLVAAGDDGADLASEQAAARPKRPPEMVAKAVALVRRAREACLEEDLAALLRDLGALVECGFVDHELGTAMLRLALDRGQEAELSRVYDAVDALVKPEQARRGHLAYSAGCAAARLGKKPEMLTWLRAGKLAGDHPRAALLDPSYTRFHGDPDLRALAEEP